MRQAPWLWLAVISASGCGLVLDLDPRQTDGPGWDAGQPDTGPTVPGDAGSADAGPGLADASAPDAIPVLDGGGVESGPSGGVCNSPADCASGEDCFYLPYPPGICTPYCTTDDECSSLGPGATCAFGGSCSPSCDPITNAGCAGLACAFYNTSSGGQDTTWCLAPGPAMDGDSCEADPALCGADLWCGFLPGGATCLPKCRIGVAADCPAGRSCWTIGTDGILIGSMAYGVCGPPG